MRFDTRQNMQREEELEIFNTPTSNHEGCRKVEKHCIFVTKNGWPRAANAWRESRQRRRYGNKCHCASIQQEQPTAPRPFSAIDDIEHGAVLQSGRPRDHVSRMVRRNYLLMANLAQALLHDPDNQELEYQPNDEMTKHGGLCTISSMDAIRWHSYGRRPGAPTPFGRWLQVNLALLIGSKC